MMKIYQPLCPDITFRLAADLSPEDSEDSTASSPSSSSSEEEEEAKLRTYEEGSPKLCPSPAGASLLPSTKNTTKEIDNQDHVSSHHPTSNTPSPASATSPRGGPPHFEAPHWNRELNANQVTEYATTTAQPTPLGQTVSQSFTPDTTTLAHGTKRRADDSVTCFPTPATARLSRAGDPALETWGRENNSDDDNDSVEDVSISHNVPMCPPSPSPLTPSSTASPRERMVVVVAREEMGGGASGSSSDSEHCSANKTSGLRLQGTRRTTYQGPYTLACDVTPSPMQEQVTLANSVASTGSNVHGRVTAAATTPTTATPSSGLPSGHSSQLKVPRRPRKLPEIPRKHQGLATASSSHVRSIFDEIQEALIKEATRDEVFSPSPSPSSSSQEKAAQQYPYIHKHVAHLFDKKRLLIGYASSGPACYAERSREASISSLSSRSRHVSTSSVHDVSSRSRHVSTSSAHDVSNRSRHVSTSSAHDVSSRSRHVSTSSVASEAGAAASVEEEEERERRGEVSVASCRAHHLPSPSSSPSSSSSLPMVYQQLPRRRKDSDDDGSRRRRHTSSSSICPLYQDMEVTHRGMHRFIPRHADELAIGIGDPIHVLREYDDLWCEGVNLRSGERGIFPAMYANDLTFLEDSDGDEEHWKFTMRFLGAVEVTSSSGDFALCQAINKVAQQGRVKTSSLCTLEINQYGIRMIDKSKEGHQSQKFSNFFALKNISFCGTHPNNNRYFAFITKHPREMRFACHVFHSDRSTHRARDALGNAFKRFYQEYMAFTHPTEDIWME